jgi:hypothetical protein
MPWKCRKAMVIPKRLVVIPVVVSVILLAYLIDDSISPFKFDGMPNWIPSPNVNDSSVCGPCPPGQSCDSSGQCSAQNYAPDNQGKSNPGSIGNVVNSNPDSTVNQENSKPGDLIRDCKVRTLLTGCEGYCCRLYPGCDYNGNACDGIMTNSSDWIPCSSIENASQYFDDCQKN